MFGTPQPIGNEYTRNEWGDFNTRPRQLADVNGDGRADIVAFGDTATFVSLGQVDGTFGNIMRANESFSLEEEWTSFDDHPRQLADVNGDGRADIVGFGDTATWVSLGQEDGTFGGGIVASRSFDENSGWNSFDDRPRQVADVNGDGRADVVGFRDDVVFVALGQEDGTFGETTRTINEFGPNTGWNSFNSYPLQVADVNGDTQADIIGFGENNLFAAYATPAADQTITGTDGNDTLTGAAGNDTISGLSGDDILTGRAGSDVLTGDSGADRFVFDQRVRSGVDTITDFNNSGQGDHLVLSRSVFRSIAGNDLTLKAGLTVAEAEAGTFTEDLGYTTNGQLYYNANGASSGLGNTGGHFATLQGTPMLTSDAIEVVV